MGVGGATGLECCMEQVNVDGGDERSRRGKVCWEG